MKRMGKKTCGEEGKLKGRRSEEEGRRWGKTVIMYIHVQRLSKNELWNLQSATHQVWATWNCLPKKRNKMKVTLTASLWSRCCLSAWIWTEDSAAICWTSWHKTGSWETSFWSNSRLIWGTETELCILYRTVKRRPERNLSLQNSREKWPTGTGWWWRMTVLDCLCPPKDLWLVARPSHAYSRLTAAWLSLLPSLIPPLSLPGTLPCRCTSFPAIKLPFIPLGACYVVQAGLEPTEIHPPLFPRRTPHLALSCFRLVL